MVHCYLIIVFYMHTFYIIEWFEAKLTEDQQKVHDALLAADDDGALESQIHNEKKRAKAQSERADKYKKKAAKAISEKNDLMEENATLTTQIDINLAQNSQLLLEVTQERDAIEKGCEEAVKQAREEERAAAYNEGVEEGKQMILPRLAQIKNKLDEYKMTAKQLKGEMLRMEANVSGLLDQTSKQYESELSALKNQSEELGVVVANLEAEKVTLHSDLEKAEEALMNYARTAIDQADKTLSSIMKKMLPPELVEKLQQVQNVDKIGIKFADVAQMGPHPRRFLAQIGLQLINMILEPLKAGDKDYPGVFRAMMDLRGVSETPFGIAMAGVVDGNTNHPIYDILFDSYKRLMHIGDKVCVCLFFCFSLSIPFLPSFLLLPCFIFNPSP